MGEYSPDYSSPNRYSGIISYTVGDNMKTCLRDTIEVISDYNVELFVKPHPGETEEKL